MNDNCDEKTKTPAILRPGENVWRSALAEKLAILVDGADYFAVVEKALARASQTIWIVGWDFNPDIRLHPEQDQSPTLGMFLRSLVDQNEKLQVRILVWAMGPIYSGKSLHLFKKVGWVDHPRIHLQFDAKHPLRGSHHQKMVCIDDVLAFAGGIDLTARRWDTSAHEAVNPLRVTPDGQTYEPVHDMQVALSGEAARLVGDLCRRRWKRATGKRIAPTRNAAPIWPHGLAGDFEHCPIALARTEPAAIGRRAVNESITLACDALRAAMDTIYIEAQYLASFEVADVLQDQLQKANGPEIVVVVTRISHGLVEKVMMGENRDRLIRQLKRNDPHDRLWVMYAVVADGDGEQEVLIHSKLIVVDDRFLRIGSSNLNNRSEGLDTEADIAIEARTDKERRAIARLRNRLVAEHLGADVEKVERTMQQTGSLMAVIRAYNTGQRGLRHFDIDLEAGATEPVIGTGLIDPKKPFAPFRELRRRAGSFTSWLGTLL